MAFSNLWGWACSLATCSVPFSHLPALVSGSSGTFLGTGTAVEVASFPSFLKKFTLFNSEALDSLCQADFLVGLRMVTGLFWRPLSLQLLIFSREASPWVASCEERFRGSDFQWYHFQPWPSPLLCDWCFSVSWDQTSDLGEPIFECQAYLL